MPTRVPQTSIRSVQHTFPRCQCHHILAPRLFFSSTAQNAFTRQRDEMWRWLNGPGAVFKDPLPGSTNYLNAYDREGRLLRSGNRGRDESADAENQGTGLGEQNVAGDEVIPKESSEDLMPFPLNQHFKSQAVLSEEFKDQIYHQVVELKKSVKLVSAELNVEMRRIGAVVRLKTIEKQWVEQGKSLAKPYANAVLGMLPQTPYVGGDYQPVHESIHDLPVHRATLKQIFYPVSESRHFTRADAGKVFSRSLLPTEARVPHPELVRLELLKREGVRRKEAEATIWEKERIKDEQREAKKKEAAAAEERRITKVVPREGGKWEFRFKDISVQDVGKDGRSRKGVGFRYGLPAQDRKRGQIKIPTRVE